MQPFHQNAPDYQRYANAWNQGTYDQIPDQEVRQHYGQFIRTAPPQVVEDVHQQYYDQIPQQERGGFFQNLLNGFLQRGYDPREAGVNNPDPNAMSSRDAARLTGYAQQRDPDFLDRIMGPGGLLGSAGAKAAIAGLLGLAAQHFLGGPEKRDEGPRHGGIL